MNDPGEKLEFRCPVCGGTVYDVSYVEEYADSEKDHWVSMGECIVCHRQYTDTEISKTKDDL